MSPLPGDPIWHVSSSSGVATSVSELLYPCYFYLLYLRPEQHAVLAQRRPAMIDLIDSDLNAVTRPHNRLSLHC